MFGIIGKYNNIIALILRLVSMFASVFGLAGKYLGARQTVVFVLCSIW